MEHHQQQEQEHNIVSDEVLVNGIRTILTLSSDGILYWVDQNGKLSSLCVEKQVLGLTTVGLLITVKALVSKGGGVFCLGRGSLCRTRHTYVMIIGRPKKLYVFVNPYGGKKSASKIFSNDVKPLLEDANIEFTMQETKYQLHAKEVSRSLDLTKYDGIVCVSGDGILVEVVNGLLEREDWAAALKTPLGAIPAGTGNGMIKSLLDSVGEPCTPANAILAAIRGHKRSLDVATIWQGETVFFSVLMLA
ncbi:ATP-NAD kinase-like domain-containing protein, partial [Tanacetum coccineum]